MIVRHRIDFDPSGEIPLYVYYGWEPLLGFWAELRTPGKRRAVAEYGSIWPGYRHEAPLLGLLEWLAQMGAFSATALNEALLAYASPEPVRLSRDGKKALDVLETLKKEAD